MSEASVREDDEGEVFPQTCRLPQPITMHPATRSTRTQRPRKQGFTLLEIIIALAMTLLLVSAVYMAIDIHWRLSYTGRGAAHQAQLERAIFQQFETDLRSVVFRMPEVSSSGGQASEEGNASSGSSRSTSSGSTSSSSNSSQSIQIVVDSPQDALAGYSMGVVGDANSLIVHISRPSRDGTMGSGDLRSVSYFIAERGADGLRGAVAQRFPEVRNTDPDYDPQFDHLIGLSRLDGDRLSIEYADQQTNGDEILASQTEVIAREVISLQFRYFDGSQWYDNWDSQVSGRLPTAIEVTLGFVYEPGIPRYRRPGITTRRTKTIGHRRYVVVLPLGVPSTTDSIL